MSKLYKPFMLNNFRVIFMDMCPFAFDHPPQRQNCKIMLQNFILQFQKQLGEKALEGLFDKLILFPADRFFHAVLPGGYL